MKNVHQLKNDSDVFNILESIPANENVHIYLEEVGEGVSDAVEKDANVEEPETDDEDANVEESRKDAKEHDATCNVEEADETIVEDVNVEEPEIVEDTNVEEPETVVEDVNIEESEKDANEHDAYDAAAENILEEDVVEVEDVVEEDACSNEVGGGNTIAGDAEPAMVEEGESEMNEAEKDVDSGFFYSDSDVGEDEVAQADVSHTVGSSRQRQGPRQPLRQKLPIRSSQKSIHQQPPSQHSAGVSQPPPNQHSTGQNQPLPSQHSTGQSQPHSVMNVRWMMSTQESSVSNPPAQASNAHD
ncbi:hypothetical protein V6N11_072468 [Hibiscus sabdariffa]|uniref:Uncharacterized protein n=1 Tax=Hibiscus sabdariffa TaxID=183260 RepID=A0ABR2U3U3_9ROSI